MFELILNHDKAYSTYIDKDLFYSVYNNVMKALSPERLGGNHDETHKKIIMDFKVYKNRDKLGGMMDIEVRNAVYEIIDIIQCNYKYSNSNEISYSFMEMLLNCPKYNKYINQYLKYCLHNLNNYVKNNETTKERFININTFKLMGDVLMNHLHKEGYEAFKCAVEEFTNDILINHNVNRYIVGENQYVNKLLPIKTWFYGYEDDYDIKTNELDLGLIKELISNQSTYFDANKLLFLLEIIKAYINNYPDSDLKSMHYGITNDVTLNINKALEVNGNPIYKEKVLLILDEFKRLDI